MIRNRPKVIRSVTKSWRITCQSDSQLPQKYVILIWRCDTALISSPAYRPTNTVKYIHTHISTCAHENAHVHIHAYRYIHMTFYVTIL